jgi:hypothetical protein
MPNQRTELQREVVEALIKSKAINFDAIGEVFSKYGARAALAGDSIGVIINWRLHDICIPPFWYDLPSEVSFDRTSGPQVKR